jgi:hypothetical protein
MSSTIENFFKAKLTTETVQDRSIIEDEAKDMEQDFIDYFIANAKRLISKSGIPAKRMLIVFGHKQAFGAEVTFPISYLPLSFRQWCAINKCTGHNSVIVSVCEGNNDSIEWHTNSMRNLLRGEIVSATFAVKKHDRGGVLAYMQFRWPNRNGSGNKTLKNQPLSHGTVVRFDAIKHKTKQCEQRIKKTKNMFVNITFRSYATTTTNV